MPWDIDAIRSRFPSLRRPGPGGAPVAWLDGPAGTQVVDTCLRAINDYLLASNANHGGAFAASHETDDARRTTCALAMADLLGATDPDEVSFGPNMTTITFALSRAIGATPAPRRRDRRDAPGPRRQRGALAGDRARSAAWSCAGSTSTRTTARLDLDEPRACPRPDGPGSSPSASPPTPSAPSIPCPRIATLVHAAGAHALGRRGPRRTAPPHRRGALGADFLVCSAYKFYGPHLGMLWGRRELLEALPPYHVRPAGRRHPRPLRDGHPGARAPGRPGRHHRLSREGRHHAGRRSRAPGRERPPPAATAAGGA